MTQYRFFTIPIQAPDSMAAELNRFLASHRILSVERRLCEAGAESLWTDCIGFDDAAAGATADAQATKRKGIDYKEVLNDADFRVFAELRNLRKTFAEREGVPAYQVFSNEQLAEMVTRRIDSATALRDLAGVGEARLSKYGAAFLALLKDLLPAADAAGSGASTAPE